MKKEKSYDFMVIEYALNSYNKQWKYEEDKKRFQDFKVNKIIENNKYIGYQAFINEDGLENTHLLDKDTLKVIDVAYYDDIINDFINTKITYLNDDYCIESYLELVDLYFDEQNYIREVKR